ncbi:MAG TPA: MOSC domain-containing protein [Candidatus Sulfopaludibacter sp.]|nr:MOSC domain-containing protein [Candidatus Sulfopaludibacter sp.]
MSQPIGIIAAIHRYPVKSMMGERLNAAQIGTGGLRGDRVFSVADPATGKIASAKNPSKWPALFSFHAAFASPPDESGPLPPARITFPDGGSVSTEDEDIEARLSSVLGKPVRFLSGARGAGTLEEYWPDIEGLARRDVVTDEAMPAETFFDCAAIHFLTTATLDSLRSFYPEGRFEARRFRPNLVIETPPGVKGFPENDGWNEKILALGNEVKLKITGPCGRCVMTTLPQGDLSKDLGILKTAAQHNQARVGAYASVLQGGKVQSGDAVSIESV